MRRRRDGAAGCALRFARAYLVSDGDLATSGAPRCPDSGTRRLRIVCCLHCRPVPSTMYHVLSMYHACLHARLSCRVDDMMNEGHHHHRHHQCSSSSSSHDSQKAHSLSLTWVSRRSFSPCARLLHYQRSLKCQEPASEASTRGRMRGGVVVLALFGLCWASIVSPTIGPLARRGFVAPSNAGWQLCL